MRKHQLREFARALQERGLLLEAVLPSEEREIGYLSYDSRDLGEDTLFVCKGAAFKEEYLQQVLEAGAAAYVSETVYPNVDPAVPHLMVTDIRKAMPVLAGLFYEEAWKQLNLVGITGTKGKSTTTYYVKYILDSWMEEKGMKYDHIDNLYREICKQYARYVKHVVPYIGGIRYEEIRQGEFL